MLPKNVPPDQTELAVIDMLFEPCTILPVYAASVEKLVTVIAMSIVQLPVAPPAPSKMAFVDTGAPAPPVPPDVVDQLAALLQFPPVTETQ